jgi:hypothetical protein
LIPWLFGFVVIVIGRFAVLFVEIELFQEILEDGQALAAFL